MGKKTTKQPKSRILQNSDTWDYTREQKKKKNQKTFIAKIIWYEVCINTHLKAAKYSASLMGGFKLPLKAIFTLNPTPSSAPHSSGAPVPGKKFPSSWRCMDIYKTVGSL